MATRKEKEAAKKGSEKPADEAAGDEGAEASLALRESSELDTAAEESEEANDESQEDEQSDELAVGDSAGDSEDAIARQLGADRYVMAGFFALAILGGYVLGKTIQTIWGNLASRDWFNQSLPSLASVAEESRTTASMVLGGVVALVLVFRTYRRPDVRTWTDEVASELMKVKWPTKKDVTNSTLVVIAASSFATLYLALLDRLWSFVTSIVYRTGS
ncbi:MAG TPA: preprotein translocase subunit SecE [Polyangium sp.]|nr:preprotein translocase subunit SecE [Polyangium sp.]